MKSGARRRGALQLEDLDRLGQDQLAVNALIADEADLAGLPELQRVQAQAKAGEMGKTGWVFTLHAPSFVPFMTYAEKRSLRHDLYMAYHTRCLHDNADNNESVVKSIVNLRR